MRTSHQEAGGGLNVEVSRGELVAGELLQDHAVKGLVLIEGANDPITVRPSGLAQVVLFVPVALAKARDVEPVPAPALAVGGRGEQAGDEVLVSSRVGISEERVDLVGRGRQAGEVKCYAANQRATVGARVGCEPFNRELFGNEG